MTPQIADPVVEPVATSMLTAMTTVFAQLDALTGQPARPVCLRAGTRPTLLTSTTEDECCSRLVWLRWTQLYPSVQQPFPAADGEASPCDIRRWAVGLELGAARCAPAGTGTVLPSCDDWETVVRAGYDDGAALRRSVLLWQQSHPHDTVKVMSADPGDVEGGCVTTTLQIVVAAPAVDCWEET